MCGYLSLHILYKNILILPSNKKTIEGDLTLWMQTIERIFLDLSKIKKKTA